MAAWGDYDDDGCPDLYLADYTMSRDYLFRSLGNGRLEAADNLISRDNLPCIGAAWGDYDNDGRLDLCVASWSGTASRIYRNLGGGSFQQLLAGITFQGNHNYASWADVNNDGFLDLLMTFGRNSLFLNNGDGTFTSIANSPIVNDVSGGFSYGGAWWDYDNDGFLDLFVVNGNDAMTARIPNFLYHNKGHANSWLRIKPVGTLSNRDGVGAKVRVRATYAGETRWQRRDITGANHAHGNQLIAHFGLGDATNAELVRIEWPSGQVTELRDVPARQVLTVVEQQIMVLGRSQSGVDLSMIGTAGLAYDIYAAEHLHSMSETNCTNTNAHWKPWLCVTNCGEPMPLVDTNASGVPYRFYTPVAR
jgi:hypothetical protein